MNAARYAMCAVALMLVHRAGQTQEAPLPLAQPGISFDRGGGYMRRHQQTLLRNAGRRQRLAEEANKLLQLTREYRADLTSGQIADEQNAKRLDDIAKLARDVRDTMRY